MHPNSNIFRIFLAVAVLLSLTVSMVTAMPVTQSITYQGKLTDAAGIPITGTPSVTFKLYEVASGGSALATDTHTVTAAKGLFTTQITAAPSFFDGRALWLGIKVGADTEMTPRQELRPVPYALSLRPGALITSNDITSALNLQTTGGGKALNVYTTGSNSDGVSSVTNGQYSEGVSSATYGQYSNGITAYTEGDNSRGVFVTTMGRYGDGVSVSTTNADSKGIDATTAGANSDGVSAVTSGDNSRGVYVVTNGQYSNGVYAYTVGANSNGINTITKGHMSEGIFASTTGDGSEGVHAYTVGQYSDGVYATTNGGNSPGVSAKTSGASSAGVSGVTEGIGSVGVNAVSAQSVGLYADTGRSDQMYGIYTPDYLFAKGTQVPATDVAEYMPVTENVMPGTVLVISKGGILAPSATTYDTHVAGIVSTDPGVYLGTKEGGNPGEALIAVSGRVPCKVDASNGAILEGDLLTTSDRPGYAMKAEPTMINGRGFYPDGTILGKAMGTLESGTGTIEVLVTLQ